MGIFNHMSREDVDNLLRKTSLNNAFIIGRRNCFDMNSREGIKSCIEWLKKAPTRDLYVDIDVYNKRKEMLKSETKPGSLIREWNYDKSIRYNMIAALEEYIADKWKD